MTNCSLEAALATFVSRPGAASLETPRDVVDALQALIVEDVEDACPLPAKGRTIGRLEAFASVAAVNLSLARLFEGHMDAIAILAEAGSAPPRRSAKTTYGVWVADHLSEPVGATRTRDGWMLRGKKRYASGARGIDRALVTGGVRLFDVALKDYPNVRPVADSWNAVGMAATESLDVLFDDVIVPEEAVVGAPGFYFERPGFWQGSVGVAACWYGGALGAYRMLRDRLANANANASEHQLAHLGAVFATCESMHAILQRAAREIDDSSKEKADPNGRMRAFVVRQIVEQGCQDVLTRVGRATGSSALAFDRAHAHRVADLTLYLRQHHAERDLVDLARQVLVA